MSELGELRRRKHQLDIRSAKYGTSTPPEVMTEIEDLDAIIHAVDQIYIHRARLFQLIKQANLYGDLSAPAHIFVEIDTVRSKIQQQINVSRSKGYSPNSDPIDTDSPDPDDLAVREEAAQPPVNLVTLNRKLDRLLKYFDLSTD